MKRLVLLVLSTMGLLVATTAKADVKVTAEGKDSIRFDIDGKLFTRLHMGSTVAKPYLWPIVSSEGVFLTRAWPMEPAQTGSAEKTTDHKHQKSAWFCHGDIKAEGLETIKKKGIEGVDFWSEDGAHGKIKVAYIKLGNDFATLELDWLSADNKNILRETRTYRIAKGTDGQRLIVMETKLNAVEHNLTFEDTKEGSFGIRVRDIMAEKGKGKLTSSEGKTREPNIWGKVLDWVDYSGEVDGKVAGLTVMADPKNAFKSCWHARGYGLLAANPFGRAKSGFPAMRGNNDLVKLKSGESLKLRFAILVHPGDAESGKVAHGFEWFKGL